MSRPSLLALPGELQNQIFLRHCDGVDRLLLRLTGARLRQKMPPPTGQELLAAESLNLFVIEKDLFTCPACASLQRRTNFDDDVTIQRKARGGYDVADRFCLACGVKEYTVVLEDGTTQTTTRYTPGTRIMVAFVSHVLYPITDSPELNDSTMSGPNLMAIPGELQNEILEHCDALDRLALRGVCRRLREIIPPPEVDDLVSLEEANVIVLGGDLYTCSM
ncbi:hypothetical protein PG985_002276 [Apiospora marii]